TGGNAYEAIKRAPGITDIQGLQFRGRQISVYIEDKPVRLDGEELKNYLTAMPAGTIDRIEVLPHPSARYEASGGAVVNIFLLKNKDLGMNGTFTAGIGAGRYPRYNNGLSLNYRSSKLNLYGSYDRMYTKVYNTRDIHRMFNDAYEIDEAQSTIAVNTSHAFRAGLDYSIGAGSSIGILVRGTANVKITDIFDMSHQRYYTQRADSFSTVTTGNNAHYFTPNLNLYYKTTVAGGDLSLNADYFSYAKDWNDHFVTRYMDAGNKEYRNPFLLRDQSPARNHVRSLSADYSLTIGKVRYETGLKAILTRTDNDPAWGIFQSGSWVDDTSRSNHFIYDEGIVAGFLTAARSFGKLRIQTGVRMEHTDTKGNSITLKQVVKKSYTNLFPNLLLEYAISDNQQLSLSWDRSIERFGFDIVNPFIIYQSQYAYYQGNPHIRPSFSQNMELSWAWRNEWMAAFSYSHYTDVPAEIYKKDAGGGAMISTYDNVSSADQMTLNITHTKSLLKGRLSTSNTLGVLHAGYHAPASTGLGNTSYTAMFSNNTRMLLGRGWRTEINVNYYSPMAVGAYRFQSQFEMGAGLSKSWMEGRAVMALNVTDIFNTSRRRYTAASYGVASTNRDYTETRFVKLSFTYKFGKSTVKAARTRSSAIEEIKNRMGN
ncbi:MAG TPA: outer membrane beta-barrel family protein, partial [Puia sp.]